MVFYIILDIAGQLQPAELALVFENQFAAIVEVKRDTRMFGKIAVGFDHRDIAGHAEMHHEPRVFIHLREQDLAVTGHGGKPMVLYGLSKRLYAQSLENRRAARRGSRWDDL